MREVLLITAIVCCGCGPKLLRPQEFSASKARQMVFDDTCGLQPYFDSGGKKKPYSDFSLNASGTATFRLAGPHSRVFVAMLSRLYRRLPPLAKAPALEVDVKFHLAKGRRSLPIGAETTVKVGGKRFDLPYHACVGAFFFGEEEYRYRKQLVAGDR